MQSKTDNELLNCYAATGDGTAFAELVSRYTPIVYRVCRRLLGNDHDAEDATQAAFVVLTQKARSLRQEGRLNGWLYRVSRLVALESLRRRSSRERMQAQAAIWQESLSADVADADRDAVLSQVDAALDSLSGVLRDAVILRYLRGFSEQEAAAQAGCPVGTMKWRASEGLAKLRQRLAKRGVALSGVALAGLLSSEASAAVPETLFPSILVTVKTVAAGATTMGTFTTEAVMLAKGAMKTMIYTQVKTAAVISASVVLIGASVPIGMAVARAGEDKPAPPTETRALPATPQPKPAQTNSLATLSLDELKKLLDEKQKALQAAYKTVEGPDVQKQRTKEAEAEKAFNGVLARTKGQANNPELEAATKTYNAALQTFSALYKEKFAAAGGPKLQEEILALQGELQRRQPPAEKPAGKPAAGQGGPVGDYWGRQNGQ